MVKLTVLYGHPDGGEPPHYRIFEGYFGYMESLQAGMSSPERQVSPADLLDFASGGATIFISEIHV